MVQTTATLNWPQNGRLGNVTAPLISEAPVSLTATVPCEVIRSMPPKGGLVLGLAPAKGKQASLNSLFVNVTSQRVDITDRNVVIASVPRARVVGNANAPLAVRESRSPRRRRERSRRSWADRSGHRQGAARWLPRPQPAPGDRRGVHRPDRPCPPGLTFSATIDTRFSTKPTALKLAAMLLAIAATAVAWRLWRLDRLDGRRMHSLIPRVGARSPRWTSPW